MAHMSVPAAYLGVIIIWSTTPLAMSWSGEEVGFLFGLSARMLLGLVASLLAVRVLGVVLPWHREARKTYVATGLGLFAAMISVYWSSQFIPSGWISVIFGLAPLVTGILAGVWLSETALTPARVAGMAVALVGLALIFAGGESVGPEAGYGIAGVVFSVVVHSASAVAVKRIGAKLPALAVTTGGLLIAVPLYLLVYFAAGETLPSRVPLRAALSIGYLGLVGSVIGFGLYFYVLRRVEATRVALIALVTPVMALLLGHALNEEPISAAVWAGTGAILSGLLFFEYGGRLMSRTRKAAPVGVND